MIKKRLQVWLPLLLALVMVFGMYLGYKMRDGMPKKGFFFLETRKPVQEILDLVKNKYVDEVDMNALSDTAIAAILYKLDPHSSYIPASGVEQSLEDISGTFYGIGIEFNIFDDTLHVVNVIKDGPAFKAGLQTGDKLLKAADSIIAGKKKSSDEIRALLRGNRGSALPLVVRRGTKTFTAIVERDYIPVTSIDAAYMIDNSIGFIRINKFSQKTYKEFMQSLESLKKAGMKKLVLDLRGNGGGVLDEAVEIADEFLEGDRLITYTEGKHAPKKEYRSRREGQFEKEQLIILADEGTASASEVLIGALQDWDRANVVGRPTFGKGLVQEQFDLSDKSAIRLTVSRYYTPLGRSIQRSYSEGSKSYFENAARRYYGRDSILADTVPVKNGKTFKTKNGKTVLEGGGIKPDYFIAGDTARLGNTTARLFSRGLLNTYGYKFAVDNAEQLKQYKTPAEFSSSFSISENDWRYFTAKAQQDTIDLLTIAPAEKTFLLKTFKLAVARQLWRHEGYFNVFNKEDPMVIKAVDILSGKK